MAFDFDKIKEGLLSAGKEVEEFAKDASAVAKLKYEIHTKEDFLEKQYALLGRAFYNAHKDEDVEEKVYFPSIDEAEEELARLYAELLDAQGAVVCPNCGEKQSDKNGFCANCGSALK
ncbi:MAG: zinc-ribbon domain-containing protein [Agathobacter sp.]|nr:zinc-ribbon domain-containing protein [Agathobacter sp.]